MRRVSVIAGKTARTGKLCDRELEALYRLSFSRPTEVPQPKGRLTPGTARHMHHVLRQALGLADDPDEGTESEGNEQDRALSRRFAQHFMNQLWEDVGVPGRPDLSAMVRGAAGSYLQQALISRCYATLQEARLMRTTERRMKAGLGLPAATAPPSWLDEELGPLTFTSPASQGAAAASQAEPEWAEEEVRRLLEEEEEQPGAHQG